MIDASDEAATGYAGVVSAVDVRQLAPGTEVAVGTTHSSYRLVVLDGAPGHVLMQGGRTFPEPTEVEIDGSKNDRDQPILGSIAVGRSFEFTVSDQRGRTSPVQTIVIDPNHADSRRNAR